jgi:hypothetical protein
VREEGREKKGQAVLGRVEEKKGGKGGVGQGQKERKRERKRNEFKCI